MTPKPSHGQATLTQSVKSFAVIEITDIKTIGTEEARLYSRMKYGDPIATRRIALMIAAEILKRPETCRYINAGETIYISSSAYGAVPTASHAISKEVEKLLFSADIKVKRIKFHRKGDFATNHYGTLGVEERAAKMTSRKIFLRPRDQERIKGQFVLIVDDINVTGSHERKLHDVLSQTGACDWAFAYAYRLDKGLAAQKPETEEYLNRAAVKSVFDLVPFFRTYPHCSRLKLHLNSRVLKFILSTKPEGWYDVGHRTKIDQIRVFLENLEDEILFRIYRAAISSDGYSLDQKFSEGMTMLRESILKRTDRRTSLARKIQAGIPLCLSKLGIPALQTIALSR